MHNGSLRLLHLTDTHLLGEPEGKLRGVAPLASLQAVQSHAAQHFANPDGVLLTGDLVQDDTAGYAVLRNAFAETTTPVYCLPGNHDVPEVMFAELNQPPFMLGSHAVLGNWLLVMLNTWLSGSAAGQLGEAQLRRLDILLNQHQHLHTLVCLHHHPIDMGSEWLDQVGLQDAAAFRRCLANHVQVRGVLWGHVHQAFDGKIDGAHYMATPATCMQFLPGSNDFALDSRPPGYRTLQLHADGAIQTEVMWL